MLLMVTIGYVFSYLIPTKQKSVLFPIQSTQAFFLAQSGVEFAVRYAKDQVPPWTTPSLLDGLDNRTRNLGSGKFTLDYDSVNDKLTSTGEVSNAGKRTIVVSNFTSFLYYFTYRKSIAVNSGQVSSGPHTDFPMLVSVTDAHLATTAYTNGHVASYDAGTNDPRDLVFMGLDDNTCNVAGGGTNPRDLVFEALDDTTCGGAGTSPCRLNHQIEKYTASTGELVAWVKVPKMYYNSISDRTVIYMYYGNSCMTASTQNASGVWDSNYKGVWHLNQATGVTAVDSTSNANSAVPNSGNPTASTGQIGGALTFASPSRLVIAANASLDLTSATTPNWTMSAWVNPSNYSNTKWPIIYSDGSYRASMGLSSVETGTDGRIENWINDNKALYSTSAAPLGSWTYVAVTRTDSTTTFYFNGSVNGSPATLLAVTNGNVGSGIGADGTGAIDATEQFLGLIDEVRVSNTVRTAGWILTEYNNQKPSALFYTEGAEE
jgi:hypothetical protein